MSNEGEYFIIEGYWKDDKSCFEGYIVKEFDDYDEDIDGDDDSIFFYGLSEKDIQQCIEDEKTGSEDDMLEFAITGYRVMDL